MQYVGVLAAFVLIMYLSVKKMSMSKVMLIATVIMALTSGMAPGDVASTIWTAFTEKTTLELAAAVLTIGLFSTAMNEFGFLEKTVSGLALFLGNVKAAIMAVPALVGTMPVLGGAALSAPLVDRLGSSLDLSPETMAAANLVFRHGMFFLFPFSPSLILAAQLSGLTVTDLIGRFWPMSVVIWVIGYFVHLRKAKAKPALNEAEREAAATSGTHTGRLSGLVDFLKYGGPLISALLLGMLLDLPLWLALLAGIALAYILGTVEKRAFPKPAALLKGANFGQVTAMFWIMAFKAFVTASPVFPTLVGKATEMGVSPALMALILPLLFGFGSASQTTTVGVLIPILVPLGESAAVRLAYMAVIYGASFTAYFSSPLHMCQVLTCQYFKVDFTKMYRYNWPILAGLAASIAVYFALLLRVI
jgi:integral membrane protein (TIGR00529 family)